MANKDVILNDGEYNIFPAAHIDSDLNVIKDTYAKSANIKTINGVSLTDPGDLKLVADIEDNLISTSTTAALSAKQGKVLKELVDDAGKIDDVKVDGTSVVDENKVAQIDLSSKVNKSGDTIAGPISRDSGGSWISGRDNATVKQTRHTTSSGSSWNPVASVKTANGNWTIGNVGNDGLEFSYDTDANYASQNNTSNVITLDGNSGGTILHTGNTADRIVAQGTSNGWYYRKYASGKAEAFYTYGPTTIACNKAWGGGGICESEVISRPTLPSGFTVQQTFAEWTATSTSNCSMSLNLRNNGASFALARPDAYNAIGSVYWHIVGTMS